MLTPSTIWLRLEIVSTKELCLVYHFKLYSLFSAHKEKKVMVIVTVTVQTGMGLISVATHKFQFPNGLSGFTGWTATGLLNHRQTKAGLFLWELAGSDYYFF